MSPTSNSRIGSTEASTIGIDAHIPPTIPITPAPVWVWSPPDPGPPDLLPGLLPRHGHLLIAGETDVGKTTVALEIAQAVLTGEPLWGPGSPQAGTLVTEVAYIMGEHHESVLQGLWRRMAYGGQPAIRVHPPAARKPLVARGMTIEKTRQSLRAWCAGAGLVIFDPLNAFAAGTDVENDSVQMRACINVMEDVADGAALLILGHMGKPYFDQQKQRYAHRETYASRGSSAIEDAVTACFYLTQTRTASARHAYRLSRRKYKGPAPESYTLKRDPVTNRHTLL